MYVVTNSEYLPRMPKVTGIETSTKRSSHLSITLNHPLHNYLDTSRKEFSSSLKLFHRFSFQIPHHRPFISHNPLMKDPDKKIIYHLVGLMRTGNPVYIYYSSTVQNYTYIWLVPGHHFCALLQYKQCFIPAKVIKSGCRPMAKLPSLYTEP